MSIQFRSRIKTAADYKNHFSDQGVCCLPEGTSEPGSCSDDSDPPCAIETTYIDCMTRLGYFKFDEELATVSCPTLSETGCCCACKYVGNYIDYLDSIDNNESESTDGLKDDVSLCECSHVGGIWAGPGRECSEYTGSWQNTFNLCTNGAYSSGGDYSIETVDRRYPEGCCVQLEGDPSYDCINVCSDTECSEEQTAANPGGMASHYPELACDYIPADENDLPLDCDNPAQSSSVMFGGLAIENNRYKNILTSPNPKNEKIKRLYSSTKSPRGGSSKPGMVSACVQNKNKNEYDCKPTRIDHCDGYWLGLKKDGVSYTCKDTSDINIVETFMRKGTVARSVVDSWKLGEHHIGGFYAGIFNDGGKESPYKSLEGWGNRETGPGQLYTIERKKGDCRELKSFTENQWAVIVAGSNYLNSAGIGIRKDKPSHKSSKFDSVRNMNLSLKLLNKIKNDYTENGFGSGNNYGWAIPSLHLSAFIYNQTKNNTEFFTNALFNKNNPAYSWTPINNWIWTSSLVDGAIRSRTAYAQNFNNGFVGVCKLSEAHGVRLVMLARIDNPS